MMSRRRLASVLSVLSALTFGVAATARADPRADLARTTCAGLDRAVASQPGGGPVLLASYRVPADGPPAVAALRDVAFTYDNALAAIALFACGKPASARRIAEALVVATTTDPAFRDGRVRNAYRAGPLVDGKPTMPGFWSRARNVWIQDDYQVGTATGNVAWAALALLDAYRRTHEATDLAAARRLLDWTRTNAFDGNAPAGFVGGYLAGPNGPMREGWKSTEHHVDLAAAWIALDRAAPDAEARRQAAIAGDFVRAMWDAKEGRFLIGTGPDGRTVDHDHSGLDASVWPLIAMPNPPSDWSRVLAFVDGAHGIGGGYGFRRGAEGVWTEGTAQMASVFLLRGLPARARTLWPVLARQDDGDGWLFATPEARIRTGLAIGPDSVTDDFYYYHLPHLGATAWAAIAATGVNPFVGR